MQAVNLLVDRLRIDLLVERLAERTHQADLTNPYRAGDDPNHAIRRHNLSLYLHQFAATKVPALLVCEAPGYRGCRLTGIPLCSRKILTAGVEGLPIFGLERGYREPSEQQFSKIQGEQSATIVWSELRDLGMLPLIWNAFPWHPHRKFTPLSNRTPTNGELKEGREFLAQIIELFAIKSVLAIGRKAQSSLHALAVPCEATRHPAHGGKKEFVLGLRRFAAGLAES